MATSVRVATKKVSYSKLCDTLVKLGCIKSWRRKRVDESFSDNGLWCTHILIDLTDDGPLQVRNISNEVYGKHAELYVYAEAKNISRIARAVQTAGIRIGEVQTTRFIVPVTYFKGSRYWE